jgi:hypothetical protein
MAKGKTKEATTAAEGTEKKEKKVRPPREKKDSYMKDNYVVVNDFNGIRTSAMHIRSVGSVLREEVVDTKGTVTAVSSLFIPGVKIKTKKDYKYMIIDKPKNKKGKSSEEDEDEDGE